MIITDPENVKLIDKESRIIYHFAVQKNAQGVLGVSSCLAPNVLPKIEHRLSIDQDSVVKAYVRTFCCVLQVRLSV